jgi:hypothetical protein
MCIPLPNLDFLSTFGSFKNFLEKERKNNCYTVTTVAEPQIRHGLRRTFYLRFSIIAITSYNFEA